MQWVNFFWGFKSSRFPEIAQNHDCGGSMVSSGSSVHKDTLKNDGVTAPNVALFKHWVVCTTIVLL